MPCQPLPPFRRAAADPGPRSSQGAGARHRSQHAALRGRAGAPVSRRRGGDSARLARPAPSVRHRRRGRTRRRPRSPSRSPVGPRNVHRRDHPPTLPRGRDLRRTESCPVSATSDDATIGHGIERAADRIGPHGPDVVVMSLGAYTDDDQPPPLAGWIEQVPRQRRGRCGGRQQRVDTTGVPGRAPRCRRRRSARLTRPRPVLQLRRLGRRLRAGGRRGQHVLHPLRRHGARDDVGASEGWATMERHQLRGAEGRGRHRPGHVPQRRLPPAPRGSGSPPQRASATPTSAPSSTSI